MGKTYLSTEYTFREIFCGSFCGNKDKTKCRVCILNGVNYYKMPLRKILKQGKVVNK